MRIAPHTLDAQPDGQVRGRISPLEILLAVPVLALAAAVMVQFALLLAANATIATAAEAGAREAALPKATWTSVAQAVTRRLSGSRLASRVDPVMIEINGRPAGARIGLAPGDEIAVTVSVDSRAAAPDLLRAIGLSLDKQKVRSRFAVDVR